MIRLMIVALAAAMSGCGVIPRCESQVVKVPVPVGCLGSTPARPVNTFNVGVYPGEKAAAQAALVDAAAWEGYAIALEVAQAGCYKKPEPPAKLPRQSERPSQAHRRRCSARLREHSNRSPKNIAVPA